MKKNSTKRIFIDTNVIERSNFFHGSDFHSLLYYSTKGVIKIYITTISKMELIDRMKKRLIEAKTEHNQLVKSLNKQGSRILKNLTKYSDLELSPLNITESLSELIRQLETNLITGKVTTIDTSNVNIEEVFELYYK